MHIHASVLDGLIFGAYLLIWLFLLRMFSVRFSETSVGKAISFIH